MPVLKVTGLSTEYPGDRGTGNVKAARDVSFEVPPGTFFTLLGPSGCGKTTTLRSIAGLERPVEGEITVGERTLYSSAKGIFVAPNKRNIGMVFQSYAIWPHMNVFENAAFPLEVNGTRRSKKDIEQKVMRVLEAVGLEQLARREATRLSGGQQQRLALARAIVMEPQLLLLDEPLSNLDAKLRHRMRFELKRLQGELGLTTVYVTHDQSEALALSHQVAVMNEGRIVQIGSPRDIYARPASRFVADFVGTTNFLPGTVVDGGRDGWRIATTLGEFRAQSGASLGAGEHVALSVRPEDIDVFEARPEGGSNVLQGTVVTRVFLGECVDFEVKVGDHALIARGHPSLKAGVGEPIFLRLDPDKSIAVPDRAPAPQ